MKTNDLVVAAGHSVDLAWVTSGENRPSDGVKKYAEQQAVKAAGDEVTVETRFLILEDLTKELLRAVTPAGVEVTGEFIHSRGTDAQTQSLQGGHRRQRPRRMVQAARPGPAGRQRPRRALT